MFRFSTYLLLWETADADVQHDAKEAIYKSHLNAFETAGFLQTQPWERLICSPKEELHSHENAI